MLIAGRPALLTVAVLALGTVAGRAAGSGASTGARPPGPAPVTVTVVPTVTPDRAGTPARPQGVRLDVRLRLGYAPGYQPSPVRAVDIWFPKGGLYDGGSYPRCSAARLNAGSPAACPPGSVMGSGSGVARADTNLTDPRITVVNGGAHEVYFYTVLNNPARVQQAVPGRVTRLGGRWSYQLHVVIPRDLEVVAGVPIVLQSLHITAGRGRWLATTYCPPSHRWAYHAVTRFDQGPALVTDGSVGCRS